MVKVRKKNNENVVIEIEDNLLNDYLSTKEWEEFEEVKNTKVPSDDLLKEDIKQFKRKH